MWGLYTHVTLALKATGRWDSEFGGFGDRWWQTIVQAIRASAAFVIVMAPDSEVSEWVEREILLA
jgi:hypothetical protein